MLASLFLALTLALPSSSLPPDPATDRPAIVEGKIGEELDAYLETCSAFGFSGCALVQREGKTLLRKGYGLARADLDLPNTPETLYDIASASKQVTAAAILLLESRGELSTDDSIAEHLPGVPKQHEEVTIHHLLTHTSGFPRGGPAGRGPDLEKALATYFSAKRTGRAGKRHEYYNGGYAMLAGIVERVTGESFEDWVVENLFEPAGMKGTDFIETARVDEDLLAGKRDGRGLTTDYIKGWGYKGMGGVLTSVSDLALWCNALFGGEVLPEDALAKMLEPDKDDYACGWYVFKTPKGRRVIQHGGTAPGFQSYIRWFPDDEVLILVTTNREGFHWQTAWGLTSIVLDEDPKAALPPETAELSSSKLEAFCGTWESEGERLVVARAGEGLQVGVLGSTLSTALSTAHSSEAKRPSRARAKPASSPSATALAEAESRALAILEELAKGKTEKLSANLKSHIPKSWPNTVLTKLWPAYVKRWGRVRGMHALGSFFDPASNRTRVWIRVDHGKAESSIEVAFQGDQLNILDLKAPDYPVVVGVAAVDDRHLVGFDFQDEPPFELELRGKGKRRTLVFQPRGGSKLTFELAKEK